MTGWQKVNQYCLRHESGSWTISKSFVFDVPRYLLWQGEEIMDGPFASAEGAVRRFEESATNGLPDNPAPPNLALSAPEHADAQASSQQQGEAMQRSRLNLAPKTVAAFPTALKERGAREYRCVPVPAAADSVASRVLPTGCPRQPSILGRSSAAIALLHPVHFEGGLFPAAGDECQGPPIRTGPTCGASRQLPAA